MYMIKLRLAVVAVAVAASSLVGISAATASSGYTFVRSWTGVTHGCSLTQELFTSTTNGHNYQQGRVTSTNGDLCEYIQIQAWPADFSTWSTETRGSNVWSPLSYDGSGYTVQGCIHDLTVGSGEFCTTPY